MNQKQTYIAGSLFGLLGVALGAFGAHAMKSLLAENGRTETFELAVRYQFFHALALLAIGLLMEKFGSAGLRWASTAVVAGVILFSGSLYAYSFTNIKAFAMLTPFGGVFLLAGWTFLLWRVIRSK